MNRTTIIPPKKISSLSEMHMHSLAHLFLQDPVGNKLRDLGIGWTVCKETYHLHNVLPSSPSIAFVISGEKQLHYDGEIERCPRGGLTLFPAGVPVYMSNVNLTQNDTPRNKENLIKENSSAIASNNEHLGYVALCASFSQEIINTVTHLLASETSAAQKSKPLISASAESPLSEFGSEKSHAFKAHSSEFGSDDFLLAILENLYLICNSLSSNETGSTNILATRMLENILLLIASHDFGASMLHGVTGLDVLPLRLREIVRKRLSYPWKLAEVASDLHMTERTLRRHLEKSGQGLRELLRSERLHAGLVMLQQTNHSVEAIAYDCGYSSASRFSRRFQELFGVLPTEMRKARGDWGVTLSV